jgi:serine/threonine-protein kinase RsbW
VEIRFALQLPRDALSVPVVRRVLRTSMLTLGVDDLCVKDIEVALTEACTNVLDHAGSDDEYEVVAALDDNCCVIDVVDKGRGFDAERLGHAGAAPMAEEGRGIQLIRALVDRVNFKSRPETGMVVHLEKELAFQANSAIQRLAERTPVETGIDLTRSSITLVEGQAALEQIPAD